MLEPFIWMFKTNNFKKHFLYLFFSFIKFILAAIILAASCYFLIKNIFIQNIFYLLCFILFMLPFLLVQGYFWELTECIISRDLDIRATNVYNGKIKSVFNIELPEINSRKFIWRGIASIVASILMVIPFVLLMFSGGIAANLSGIPPESLGVLYIFIMAFIPALLWNYSSRNSVFAVWNIRKAIYLMGNYTGKYIFNIILFIIFYTADYFILIFLAEILDLNKTIDINNINVIKVLIWTIVAYIKYFYSLYVYAYLLGTIAPSGEN